MPLFDPATGRLLDPEALRAVQVNARGRTVPRVKVTPDGKKVTGTLDQNTGEVNGAYIEHKSGRIDCDVVAKAPGVDLRS